MQCNTRKHFCVRQKTIDEGIASLPPVQEFGEPIPPIDLFIGAAGFEERVLAVPNSLKEMGVHITGACLLAQYRTNQSENTARLATLQPQLEELGGTVKFFDGDSPAQTKNSIDTEISALDSESNNHVVFDVSGASSKLIFSVLASLFATPRSLKLTLLYTEAIQYHEPDPKNRNTPILDWGDEDLREYGVAEVEYNELYKGMHQDHLPGYVVAFPSMFPNRLQRCLSHLGVTPLSSPKSTVHWVIPATPSAEHQWRGVQTMNCLYDLFYADPNQTPESKEIPAGIYTNCDVFDYIQSIKIVMEQIERLDGQANLSLIHMGTKLQAVGAAIALAARPEMALVSSRPNSFAAHRYSKGAGKILVIKFQSQLSIIQVLAGIGSLEIA